MSAGSGSHADSRPSEYAKEVVLEFGAGRHGLFTLREQSCPELIDEHQQMEAADKKTLSRASRVQTTSSASEAG
jgi:hypothetical protein